MTIVDPPVSSTANACVTLDDLRLLRTATVTLADTARVLDIDERTVSRGCAEGQLPHVRVGRRLLILREPLIALLEGRTSAVVEEVA